VKTVVGVGKMKLDERDIVKNSYRRPIDSIIVVAGYCVLELK
jgi:hypothetical protein